MPPRYPPTCARTRPRERRTAQPARSLVASLVETATRSNIERRRTLVPATAARARVRTRVTDRRRRSSAGAERTGWRRRAGPSREVRRLQPRRPSMRRITSARAAKPGDRREHAGGGHTGWASAAPVVAAARAARLVGSHGVARAAHPGAVTGADRQALQPPQQLQRDRCAVRARWPRASTALSCSCYTLSSVLSRSVGGARLVVCVRVTVIRMGLP